MRQMSNKLTACLLAAVISFLSFTHAARSAVEPSIGALTATEAWSVTELRTEYKANPIGIDIRLPRFSWQITSNRRGVLQSAYQIQIARDGADFTRRLFWNSEKIKSDQSIQVVYAGPELESARRYFWRVRVWDDRGEASSWSDAAFWETGLLRASDWQASWIEPDLKEDVSQPGPVPLVRSEFTAKANIKSARAYVTSHGLYELFLNGTRVGDQVFTPGWTSYNKRLQYQTYDVTDELKAGPNGVGALLGSGWYRGNIGFSGQRNFYGNHVALLLQIQINYNDGSQQIVGTGPGWKSATGPILSSEIYNGETYDARLEKTGWTLPGYDAGNWSGSNVVNHSKDFLVAPAGPPVRKVEEVKPVRIIKTPAGDAVVDMGQNMVGWVRFKCQGPTGTVVTLRHAEVLDKDGNFYTANLRGAKETVKYILAGRGLEAFEPHFTFQGFRYVAVDGYPGELSLDNLTGIVIHSDMSPTGELETSSQLINRLQKNIVWGQKGNFLDVPTDCPQRDERLGWTGDAQVFARTAAFNMNVAGFYTKWLKDVAADQLDTGSIPYVIPDVLSTKAKPAGGAAGWADVSVVIPWTMYLTYGDKRILEEQYDSMTKWVEYMKRRAGDDYIWDGDYHFGDWLAFATTRPDYPGATTSKDFIATAFYAHSTDLMRRIAHVLAKESDATRYGDLFDKIKSAFQKEYVTENGRVGEDTQTAYVLALDFDLLPEALRANAANRLARDVRSRGHLTTGFLGTPYLCHVLSRFGHLNEAYLLLNREEYPSWLYPVKQGATTIWERWDGQKPDGSFQDRGMNSFNHYAYGSIGDWMYEVMAGIDVDNQQPGYKHILIAPHPGGNFTRVRASHISPYGTVSSEWEFTNGDFVLTVEVPANTRATVRLPQAKLSDVRESGKGLVSDEGIEKASIPVRTSSSMMVQQVGSEVVVEVGSGKYIFKYKLSANQ